MDVSSAQWCDTFEQEAVEGRTTHTRIHTHSHTHNTHCMPVHTNQIIIERFKEASTGK
jgi:hypothetical protein